jgi:hypothetical protein
MSKTSGIFLTVVLLTQCVPISAQTITEPSCVTISVTAGGYFTIQCGDPAWVYGGQIEGTVVDINGPSQGQDSNTVSTNGLFDEFTVDYSDPLGNPWRMQLRAYRDVPSAIVAFSPLVTVPNQAPYAELKQFPITPHHFSL